MSFKRLFVWQDESISHRFEAKDFDLVRWQSDSSASVLHGGRGGSMRIGIDGQDLVLRKYLRGGMMARLLGDRYLWTGLVATRPYRENRMVQQALENQLPVPPVIAYCIIRSGVFYRAAIISRYVANQGTLAGYLKQRRMDDKTWRKLGGMVWRLHAAGIFHADLNANNILIDEYTDFILIDFDRARPIIGEKERKNNLDRLLRSLHKIQRQQQPGQAFHFSEQDWKSFLAGYLASSR